MNEQGKQTDAAAIDTTTPPPRLTCYAVDPHPPEMVPARAPRDWMDATDQRYAYRCIPLSMANASGWELLTPAAFEVTWSGGSGPGAISIRAQADRERVERLVTSHFGHGVLTFHVGYLFRTSPGWALWVRGSPNSSRRNIVPLDGLVETDWLDFPFTMNWRFTRPSTVRFEAGEPFCFITLSPHALLDRVEPVLASLDGDPRLRAAYEARVRSRADFNRDLLRRDEATIAQGWQRHYVKGEDANGPTDAFHVSRRRLHPPKG